MSIDIDAVSISGLSETHEKQSKPAPPLSPPQAPSLLHSLLFVLCVLVSNLVPERVANSVFLAGSIKTFFTIAGYYVFANINN